MEDEHERGQATPLLVAMVGLAAVLLLSLGPMGRVVAQRAQARTAADAAALAGAAEGREAAAQVAGANGADLVAYDRSGDHVTVEVVVDGVRAASRARRNEIPVAGGGGGGPGQGGLAPGMVAAIAAAERLLGQPVPIASGFRSRAQQEALWARRGSNPYPVARPGSSMHERGLAIDVPRGFVDELLGVAAAAGLCQPLPATDPVHFELCGSR
jgi:D-alanyl-D-alanine carboxypeptidase/Putative Flp pilus-assembly TadE/G-like